MENIGEVNPVHQVLDCIHQADVVHIPFFNTYVQTNNKLLVKG